MGSGDGYSAYLRRRAIRGWVPALAAIIGFVGVAMGGYAIGSSQVGDADAAWQAGRALGEQRGTAVGTREGYAGAFKSARDQAYDAAYREAYAAAYVLAFQRGGLDPPRRVKVSGP